MGSKSRGLRKLRVSTIVSGEIKKKQICELGHILSGNIIGRKNSEQITIADLTGVAVQDVQIATAVFESYLERTK